MQSPAHPASVASPPPVPLPWAPLAGCRAPAGCILPPAALGAPRLPLEQGLLWLWKVEGFFCPELLCGLLLPPSRPPAASDLSLTPQLSVFGTGNRLLRQASSSGNTPVPALWLGLVRPFHLQSFNKHPLGSHAEGAAASADLGLVFLLEAGVPWLLFHPEQTREAALAPPRAPELIQPVTRSAEVTGHGYPLSTLPCPLPLTSICQIWSTPEPLDPPSGLSHPEVPCLQTKSPSPTVAQGPRHRARALQALCVHTHFPSPHREGPKPVAAGEPAIVWDVTGHELQDQVTRGPGVPWGPAHASFSTCPPLPAEQGKHSDLFSKLLGSQL